MKNYLNQSDRDTTSQWISSDWKLEFWTWAQRGLWSFLISWKNEWNKFAFWSFRHIQKIKKSLILLSFCSNPKKCWSQSEVCFKICWEGPKHWKIVFQNIVKWILQSDTPWERQKEQQIVQNYWYLSTSFIATISQRIELETKQWSCRTTVFHAVLQNL